MHPIILPKERLNQFFYEKVVCKALYHFISSCVITEMDCFMYDRFLRCIGCSDVLSTLSLVLTRILVSSLKITFQVCAICYGHIPLEDEHCHRLHDLLGIFKPFL